MKKLLIILALISTQVFAKGNPTEDFQIWVPINTNVKINDNWRGFLEVQPRIGHDANSLDTGIIRPAVGYAVNNNWTVWAGYLLQASRDAKSNEYSLENRSWQGLTYKEKFGDTIFEVRNRLEQRFLPHNGDISHRWRTRARVEYIFPNQTAWSLIGSEELFINLNNNENDIQLRSGVAQNRAYAGVGYRFNPSVQVETGYLNQYSFNYGSKADANNDAWMTNVNLNF
jgi:hypothetical protein